MKNLFGCIFFYLLISINVYSFVVAMAMADMVTVMEVDMEVVIEVMEVVMEVVEVVMEVMEVVMVDMEVVMEVMEVVMVAMGREVMVAVEVSTEMAMEKVVMEEATTNLHQCIYKMRIKRCKETIFMNAFLKFDTNLFAFRHSSHMIISMKCICQFVFLNK